MTKRQLKKWKLEQIRRKLVKFHNRYGVKSREPRS